jgi:hypothetical protein
MSKCAHQIYYSHSSKPLGESLGLWDMFGGIGTDSIHLSRYFNVITTELDRKTHAALQFNLKVHQLNNVNAINDNCLNWIRVLRPDVIYYDPPWGESYRPKTKNFDFNQVYLQYPSTANDEYPCLTKYINCVELAKYLFENVSSDMIIKAPLNSMTFERVFREHIVYVQRYQHKNLKFLFLSRNRIKNCDQVPSN